MTFFDELEAGTVECAVCGECLSSEGECANCELAAEMNAAKEETMEALNLNLNGLKVVREGDTLFVPLPRELWRDSGDGKQFFDTLAVACPGPQDDPSGLSYSWMVCYPKLHGR